MKISAVFLLFLGVAISTQINLFNPSPELDKVLRGHITTCTACHIATGVIQDKAAVKHANKLLHEYCIELPSKYQKLCHGFVERIFENALELANHFTYETNCESFCESNAQPLTTETLCKGVTFLLDNIESVIDILELKVKSVCSTEANAEGCLSQFQQWRPVITNFLKRSILRVVNELEPKTLCNINLNKIPKAEAALKMPKLFPQLSRADSSGWGCTLCQYMFEGACEMLTSTSTFNAFRFANFLAAECLTILKPLNFGNITDQICTVNVIEPIVYPLLNKSLWPQACHLVDSKCPVNPNPMCEDVSKTIK